MPSQQGGVVFSGACLDVDKPESGSRPRRTVLISGAGLRFNIYVPNDDNRKFTELYNVQRLRLCSSHGSVSIPDCLSGL